MFMEIYRLCGVPGVTAVAGVTVVAGDGVGDASIRSSSSIADLVTRLFEYFLYCRAGAFRRRGPGSSSTTRSRFEGENPFAPLLYLGFFSCLDHQVSRVT